MIKRVVTEYANGDFGYIRVTKNDDVYNVIVPPNMTITDLMNLKSLLDGVISDNTNTQLSSNNKSETKDPVVASAKPPLMA